MDDNTVNTIDRQIDRYRYVYLYYPKDENQLPRGSIAGYSTEKYEKKHSDYTANNNKGNFIITSNATSNATCTKINS